MTLNLKDINRMITAREIRIHTTFLPLGLYGFVYYSRKGRYHIFISQDLSIRGRQETLMHEIHHIMEDMPMHAYILGLDKQWEQFEKTAVISQRRMLRRIE